DVLVLPRRFAERELSCNKVASYDTTSPAPAEVRGRRQVASGQDRDFPPVSQLSSRPPDTSVPAKQSPSRHQCPS
ncbi:hypothetical protein Hamer_G031880, partial [Homarus americanus]